MPRQNSRGAKASAETQRRGLRRHCGGNRGGTAEAEAGGKGTAEGLRTKIYNNPETLAKNQAKHLTYL